MASARVRFDFNDLDEFVTVPERHGDRPLPPGAEVVLFDSEGNTMTGRVISRTTGFRGAILDSTVKIFINPESWKPGDAAPSAESPARS